MKITANELVKLMYSPMSNNKVIEAIESLGLEQPLIDNDYEEEGAVYVEDPENSGITFIFKEIDGYTKNGEPCLVQIDFEKDIEIKFPYNLTPLDDYKTCCKKLGKKADFINKKFIKKAKMWLMESTIDKRHFNLVVHFTDTTFSKIEYIVVVKFNKDVVGKTLTENID